MNKKTIVIDGQQAYIPLSKGMTAIIDSKDADFVSKWTWILDVQDGKVIRVSRRERIDGIIRRVPLANHILNIKPGNIVDHKDGDRLNFRRENLRAATRAQNNRNRGMSSNNKSGFKGVCFPADKKRWKAQIDIDGSTRHLGYFKDKVSAAIAYDAAAKRHYGDFAKLNFPTASAPA